MSEIVLNEQLRAMREQSGLTVQQLSEISEIPASTVSRILSGETPNPNFSTVCGLVTAMGGSLDMLAGLNQKSQDGESVGDEEELDMNVIQVIRDTYEPRISELKEQIRDLKWTRKVLGIALAIVILFVFGILTFDLLNGGVGYIRY